MDSLGKYGVQMAIIPYYAPSAIFIREGKQLSEFIYYNVQSFTGEYASACDETTTFLIDKTGSIVVTMPKIKGIGTIRTKDSTIIADADGIRSYYKENNELIWIQDNTVFLEDGIKVRAVTYRPDHSTFVEYPELENLLSPPGFILFVLKSS